MRYGRPKYRNIKTTIDGITFDSKRESIRYCELKLLAKAKKIQKEIAKLQKQLEATKK